MAQKSIIITILITACFLFLVCSLKKPTEIDGTIFAKFVVIDTSGTLCADTLSTTSVVPHARVRMSSIDYSIPLRFETDENGIVEIKNERAAHYRISADKFLSAQYMLTLGKKALDVMLSGSIEMDLSSQQADAIDTIKVGASFLSSIVIIYTYLLLRPDVF